MVYLSTLFLDNSKNLLQHLLVAHSWSWFQVKGFKGRERAAPNALQVLNSHL